MNIWPAEYQALCQGCEVGWALSPPKRANTGTEEQLQDEEMIFLKKLGKSCKEALAFNWEHWEYMRIQHEMWVGQWKVNYHYNQSSLNEETHLMHNP